MTKPNRYRRKFLRNSTWLAVGGLLSGCGDGDQKSQAVMLDPTTPVALPPPNPATVATSTSVNAPSGPAYVPGNFTVSELKTSIFDGVFTGNGLVGTMTYIASRDPATGVRVDVGRTDLYDHRPHGARNTVLYTSPRLPLGHFLVDIGETITKKSGTMYLYDAYAAGTFTTATARNVQISTTTLRDEDFVIIDVSKSATGPAINVSWMPAPSVSPRISNHPLASYVGGNPAPTTSSIGDCVLCTQPMSAGGAYGICYRKIETTTCIKVIALTFYSTTDSAAGNDAVAKLAAFSLEELPEKIDAHRNGWHQYYALSTYRIPDPEFQSFYDMQVYKFGCAGRRGGPAIDLQGPWAIGTTWWAGYWFNLNMQLTYAPLYAANRLDIATTLIDILTENETNLAKNVPTQYQADSAALTTTTSNDLIGIVSLAYDSTTGSTSGSGEYLGNLSWLLFYVYQHYRFTMDPAIGKKLYPLLRRSVQYAVHLSKKNSAGRYQLAVKTGSPEYSATNGRSAFDNPNYDVAIVRWSLGALLQLDRDLGMNSPDASSWRNFLDNYVDYSSDSATGYRISIDYPFQVPHRHYSHLFMIYPLCLVTVDQPDKIALMKQSINTWTKTTNAFRGYSFTGWGSMLAMMGDGDGAIDKLTTFLHMAESPVHANTLYGEVSDIGDLASPVIESPLSMMTSLQELSLQCFSGVTRVFPAVPSSWKNVSFSNFRTDGAFLISATREGGVNQSITIFSEVGGTIKIKHNLGGSVRGSIDISSMGTDILSIPMTAGQIVMLQRG